MSSFPKASEPEHLRRRKRKLPGLSPEKHAEVGAELWLIRNRLHWLTLQVQRFHGRHAVVETDAVRFARNALDQAIRELEKTPKGKGKYYLNRLMRGEQVEAAARRIASSTAEDGSFAIDAPEDPVFPPNGQFFADTIYE